jgi:biopolymer transport protein ExbD
VAFGSFSGGKANSSPLAEINMVPLIDVMLVLLVIFIITAPLLTNSVKINLPQASSSATETTPDKVDFAIDQAGTLFWDGEPIPMSEAIGRLQEAGKKNPAPELHIRADRETKYQILAEVMAEAAKAGVSKIGFVSEPAAAAHAAPAAEPAAPATP